MDNRPYKINRPDGVTRFVIEHADHTYLIFNQKNDELFCTKQNRKIDRSARGLIHNSAEVCNRCGSVCAAAIPKESRYGRKGLTEYGRVLWFVRGDEEVYAQLDLYEIDYTAGYAEVAFVPDQQFCISNQGCQKYSYEAVYTQGEWIYTWVEKKTFKLTQPRGTGCAYTLPRFYKTIMYDDLAHLNVGPLKYANMYMLACLVKKNPYYFIELLRLWAKYPATELLYKAGFTNLIKGRAEGIKTRKINWRGKSLGKILKSSPAEIKQIKLYSTCRKTTYIYEVMRITWSWWLKPAARGTAATYILKISSENMRNWPSSTRKTNSGTTMQLSRKLQIK